MVFTRYNYSTTFLLLSDIFSDHACSVYGPPPGKTMFTFIDDLNLPEINAWGDQASFCGYFSE